MLQCLTEIFGITKSDCQCIVNGLTSADLEKLSASKSGLFLDDLPGGVHLKAITRIDACKSMMQFTLTARDNAIKTLEDDIIVALNNQYKKDKPKFIGNIGRMSYAGSLGVSRDYQGILITPHSAGDGVMILTRLMIILNAAVTLNVKILRVPAGSVMGEEVYSFPVTTAANGYTEVPIGGNPIKFPFLYNGERVEYYIAYDITEPGTPVLPKDTGINCSTCNNGIQPFSDYVNVKGVQFNSTSALNDKITDAFSHGLILDVELRCDNEQLICREYSADDAVAVIMAWAARFKAGELLIEEVLKQPDVSRYTMMAREYLWGKRNHFKKEYEDRILYLSTSLDVTNSNCYICREGANQPFVQGIYTTYGGGGYGGTTGNVYDSSGVIYPNK